MLQTSAIKDFHRSTKTCPLNECDDDGCGDVRHLSRMSWECSRPSLLWNPTLTGLWLRGCFKSEIREWIWVFELENFNCIPWCHLCPKRNYSSKEGASWCPCLEPGVLFLFLSGHLENFGQVEAFQRQGFTTKPVWLKIFEVQIYHNPHPLNKSSDSHHLSLQDYYWTNPGNEGMEKKAGKITTKGMNCFHHFLSHAPSAATKVCDRESWGQNCLGWCESASQQLWDRKPHSQGRLLWAKRA